MGSITYDVAVSLDGYISGPDDDVSAFPTEGDHVDAYFQRMQEYDAVIMGRKTYEFGYQHGLQPGQAPYPDMDHFIVATGLKVPTDAKIQIISNDILNQVSALKQTYRSIYLCGGGELAGLLLAHDLIDQLCLKSAPVILGHGVKLFGETKSNATFHCDSTINHSSGVNTMSYTLP
ncbi:MAG: dihydrofolate reductase [Pseudomonadales bacterium]|nr:dihydrofolate reductase [Pseudomonadales bacterium]